MNPYNIPAVKKFTPTNLIITFPLVLKMASTDPPGQGKL
jgi:hypothetical protein